MTPRKWQMSAVYVDDYILAAVAGDAQWAPTKDWLGFVLDGTTRTTVHLTQRNNGYCR